MVEDPALTLTPAAFIGHGSPMNALESNRYTDSWRAFGALHAEAAGDLHNLAGMERNHRDDGFTWAQRFDTDAKSFMVDDPANMTNLSGHRDWDSAVPTPDHFLPALYLAGLASVSCGGTDVLVDGYAYGSLSMTLYVLGGAVAVDQSGPGSAALPTDVPPVDTNT